MGYRPRIQRAAGLYDLPLPMRQTTESFQSRIGVSEVPLQPGTLIRSSTRGAATVMFSGMIVVGNPQDEDRVGGMGMVTDIIEEKDRLYEWLKGTDEPFTFYRYIHNAEVGGTKFSHNKTRFYRNVLCQDLEFAHSHQTPRVLPYTFSLLVPEGVEYYTE